MPDHLIRVLYDVGYEGVEYVGAAVLLITQGGVWCRDALALAEQVLKEEADVT